MDTKKGYAELGKTAAGKTIVAKLHPHNGMFFACFLEGGELPQELRGNFTNRAVLKTKTEAYLSRMAHAQDVIETAESESVGDLEDTPVPQVKVKAAKAAVKDDSKLETAEERLNKKLGMIPGVELLGKEEPVEFETATHTAKAK